MNKCHTPIVWHNDTTPAINETNLNYEDGCIDTIDDRVISLDTTKANQSDLLTAMADWDVDNATGDVTITLKNGQTITRHTNLGKIAINVRVIHDPTDPHYQEMEITMPDGTKDYVDFSAFVTQFEFVDSSEIHASVNSDGEVSFSLINGSITGAKLQPNYLADVTAQATIASNAATTSNANQLLSEGYANGTQGGVPVSTSSPYYHNNAKYWKEQAQAIASSTLSGLSDVDIVNPSNGQVLAYDNGDWVNAEPVENLDDLADTSIASLADGEALIYDAADGKWENKAIPTPSTTLDALTDTNIVSPAEGDYLAYNATSNKWENKTRYKTFATASDAEIAEMVRLADAGEIDLYEDCGWRVGQEHQVSLSAIAASGSYDGISWTVGEAQAAQTITLVLMHKGLYELVEPVLDKQGQTRNTCSFVVGVKDCLAAQGYYNSTATNTGSWESAARRQWCNGGFRSALPSSLRSVFKKVKTITASSATGTTNQVSQDYFFLAAEKEIIGAQTNSVATEANALTQFTWYETVANRIKKANDAGVLYWTRSPRGSDNTRMVEVNDVGTSGFGLANNTTVVYTSPVGCL